MDSIISTFTLKSNRDIDVNFEGGDLSSDSGLLLMKEFLFKTDLPHIIATTLATAGDAARRIHSDVENLLQMLYQIFAGYFNDDNADDLTDEHVINECVGKDKLASQPTLSRFFGRMTQETLKQFWEIMRQLRNTVYKIEGMPNNILLDMDSTLVNAYGHQEGTKYNHHYSAVGYHPLMCYDGFTGDLLRAWFREGSDYCCNGAAEMMEPLLEELKSDLPGVNLFARADSGFACPELYELFEKHNVGYVIRLKENDALLRLVKPLEMELFGMAKYNMIDQAAVYGEFEYQAKSWSHPRRVAVKVEKPAGTFMHKYSFIVTNIVGLTPEYLVKFYCKRGVMENFIKECKDGFDANSASSKNFVVNACRFQVHLLAYNAINYFRRLALPAKMKKDRIETIRFKLFKVASRVIRHSRRLKFKLCTSCVYKDEWAETLQNIQSLPNVV